MNKTVPELRLGISMRLTEKTVLGARLQDWEYGETESTRTEH